MSGELSGYLSNSRYGRNGGKVISNNSSGFLTGRSSGENNIASSELGSYEYNTLQGVLASTTGNIYGIYDMSGGAWEYVMGAYNNSLSSSGFVALPENKYYNLYTVYSSKYKGDSIFETSTSYVSQYNSWNSSYSVFFDNNNSFLLRGGNGTDNLNDQNGVFAYYGFVGGARMYEGFRIAICK